MHVMHNLVSACKLCCLLVHYAACGICHAMHLPLRAVLPAQWDCVANCHCGVQEPQRQHGSECWACTTAMPAHAAAAVTCQEPAGQLYQCAACTTIVANGRTARAVPWHAQALASCSSMRAPYSGSWPSHAHWVHEFSVHARSSSVWVCVCATGAGRLSRGAHCWKCFAASSQGELYKQQTGSTQSGTGSHCAAAPFSLGATQKPCLTTL
jgi:hypothetical protein